MHFDESNRKESCQLAMAAVLGVTAAVALGYGTWDTLNTPYSSRMSNAFLSILAGATGGVATFFTSQMVFWACKRENGVAVGNAAAPASRVESVTVTVTVAEGTALLSK